MSVEKKDRSKAYHTPQTDQLNFDSFSRCFEYRFEGLSTLMEAIPHIPNSSSTDSEILHIDVCTGNGLGIQTTKGLFEALMRKALLIGIDFDERALRVATANTPTSENIRVMFIKGYAQDLDDLLKGIISTEGVDLVTLLDAVHEIPPEDQFPVISASASKLRPGGVYVMNSAFTSIATRGFGMEWAMPTMRAAREFGGEPKEQSALLHRDPQEFTDMLLAAGLEAIFDDLYHVSTVNLTREGRMGICNYSGFIEGVKNSYNFNGDPPSNEEFAPRLAYYYGQSEKTLPRKWVRWIFRKTA